MKISVIIPTYKSKFLDQAIRSVLDQTYPHWELIIIDDCSPEDIEGVARPYLTNSRIQYHRNDHNYGAEHLAENWTNALTYCTGDYVICIGDDDILPPHALEEYVRMAEKYPDVDVIHGQTEVIDENNEVMELMEPRWEKETPLQLIYYRWLGEGRQQFIGDFCYKLSALHKNNGYYPLPLAWGSDDITAVIAATPHGIANTQKTCFNYRKNRYSISSDGNNRRKLQALMMQQAWYAEYFDSYSPANPNEEKMLELLKAETVRHFTFHTNDLIRKDISKGIVHCFFWIKHRQEYRLSIRQIIIQSIKSLKHD